MKIDLNKWIGTITSTTSILCSIEYFRNFRNLKKYRHITITNIPFYFCEKNYNGTLVTDLDDVMCVKKRNSRK